MHVDTTLVHTEILNTSLITQLCHITTKISQNRINILLLG